MGNITAKEAHKKLSSITTQEEFKALINELSVEVKGKHSDAPTLLYGGEMLQEGKVVNTSEIASKVSEDPNFRLLDNTEADRFLSSIYVGKRSHPDFQMGKDLREVLKEQFGGNPRDRSTPSNTYVNQPHGGAWDKVSENFVKASSGEIVTLIGDSASPDRIFFQTELQAIKTNDNITHIDGIEKQTLFKELEALGDPQHQINYFKTVTYAREEVAKALGVENPLELPREKMHEYLNSNTSQAIELSNKIDTYQIDQFTKTEVALASNSDYNKITDAEIKTFLSQESESSKTVLDKIDNHIKELSEYNPHIKNFDVAIHGKYAVLGAVALSILPEQADASTLHLNPHLSKDKFEALSSGEQIGAQIGAGFNTINAIQAGEEFKQGASKSASILLDSNAYKEGLTQATDAWKPSATKDVVKLGAMDSAKVAGQSLLKKLPLVGLVAGIGFGISRAMDGDWKGAGMEVASGAFSLVPGWGTAASVGMDAALLEKDTALLSHGAEKLLGRDEIKDTIQSEDNHTTIEPKQNINLSNDLDQEVLEQRVSPQTHQTLDLAEIQDGQSNTIPKIDTTEKAFEKIDALFPHLSSTPIMSEYRQRRDEKEEEPVPTQTYNTRIDDNTPTFDSYDYSAENDDLHSPKNHRPINLHNNVAQQPIEENQIDDAFDSTAYADRMIDDMAEEHGWNNDYGNGNDMGMERD